jgi:Cu-Zn family superoxide dismutase
MLYDLRMIKKIVGILALSMLVSHGAIAKEPETLTDSNYQKPAGDILSADMLGADGDKVGYATFRRAPKGVLITLNLDRITPGWHGVGIYEKGKCNIGMGTHFEDSGEHFAKEDELHGYLNPNGPQKGDLPNVWVNSQGSVKAQFFTDLVRFDSLVGDSGTALIVNSGMDDFLSQPGGNAGARIACGVITVK